MALAEGARVWLPSDDGWLAGTILSVADDGATTVSLEDGATRTVPASSALPFRNEDCAGGVDDMTVLSHLNEPSILHNLRVRFAQDTVYTYSGHTAIAVNPFKWLDLYSEETIRQYRGCAFADNPPHIFAVAEAAYAGLQASAGQSILVSGESGAGKTETTKLLLRYLATVATGSGRSVTDKVLLSNPLLESFGNATTLRNDNSSRFGKFIEVQFSPAGAIIGAKTHTYLLEKSRVVRVSEGERSYHIFYQLLAGADDAMRAELHLADPSSFAYLNQSSCIRVASLDDAQNFARLCTAMETVGIDREQQQHVFRMVAAVLHLGQISFRATGRQDDAKVADPASCALAASLLGVSADALTNALIERSITAGRETYRKPNNVEQATDSRDALAKSIYGRLFDWLVRRVNVSLQTTPGDDRRDAPFIGILDIFGFESFAKNSFEQLCINYANEKLQQQYTQDVFQSVQDEYTREGVEWSYIDFVDNRLCLDLIEGKLGILALLNEECVIPKGADLNFVTKLQNVHQGHPHLSMQKLKKEIFEVGHYAGVVPYDATGFLEKNKDSLHVDLVELVRASEVPFAQSLFAGDAGRKQNVRDNYLGSQFKQQLASLMGTINSTQVHYIRCIKPNTKNAPDLMMDTHVEHQLRYAGVLEAIRIARAAYPNRMHHRDYLRRYGVLAPPAAADECATALAAVLNADQYQLGHTRVYFRFGVLEILEERRGQHLARVIVVIQKHVRRWIAERRYRDTRSRVVAGQALVRSWLCTRRYQRQRTAAIVLQTAERGRQARRRVYHLRRTVNAIKIQRTLRGWTQRTRFQRQRRAVVCIQAMARMWIQRRAFVVQLAEAKEQAKLENQLDQMKNRLRAEADARAELEQEKMRLQQQLEQAAAAPAPASAPDTPAAPAASSSTAQLPDASLLDDAQGVLALMEKQLEVANRKLAQEKAARAVQDKVNRELDNELRQMAVQMQLERKARINAEERYRKVNDELADYKKAMRFESTERLSAQSDLKVVSKTLRSEMELRSKAEERLKRLTEEMAEIKRMFNYEARIRVQVEDQKEALQTQLKELKERIALRDAGEDIELISDLEAIGTDAEGSTLPRDYAEYAGQRPAPGDNLAVKARDMFRAFGSFLGQSGVSGRVAK